MTPPEISEDSDTYYFMTDPQHTCDLITFLRRKIDDSFSVHISANAVGYKDAEDSFEFAKSTDKNVLAGLLTTFFSNRV